MSGPNFIAKFDETDRPIGPQFVTEYRAGLTLPLCLCILHIYYCSLSIHHMKERKLVYTSIHTSHSSNRIKNWFVVVSSQMNLGYTYLGSLKLVLFVKSTLKSNLWDAILF